MASFKICVFSVISCVFVTSGVLAAPSGRVYDETLPPNLLSLPSNATSIRSNIEDSFSCEGRSYGYYADVENDCQLFHVCLPVTYANGRSQMFRWSFICPEETVFNQEMFTCTRADEAIDCAESPRFYNLNTNFGEHLNIASPTTGADGGDDDIVTVPIVQQELDALPETISESAEVTQMTHVTHAAHAQEYMKSTVPIVPIYHRRVMKI